MINATLVEKRIFRGLEKEGNRSAQRIRVKNGQNNP